VRIEHIGDFAVQNPINGIANCACGNDRKNVAVGGGQFANHQINQQADSCQKAQDCQRQSRATEQAPGRTRVVGQVQIQKIGDNGVVIAHGLGIGDCPIIGSPQINGAGFQHLIGNQQQGKRNKGPESGHSSIITQDFCIGREPKPRGMENLGKNWVGAGHLEIGDKIRKADGSSGIVLSVLNVVQARVMYNLEVQGNHDFFVGNDGWLVHNAKPPPIPEGITTNEFGNKIIRWGGSSDGTKLALERMANLTEADLRLLHKQGVTPEMAKAWGKFYEGVVSKNPNNPSAAGREKLMKHIAEAMEKLGFGCGDK
jgi:hypothetical protein